MKPTLLLVSLCLLGCYQDETGIAAVKYDAGRSFGGAIGTPAETGGSGGHQATTAAAGTSEPGTGGAAGGATDSNSGASAAGGASATAPGDTGGTPGTGSSARSGVGGNPDAGMASSSPRDAGSAGAGGSSASTSACEAAASGGPSGMKSGQDCVSCHGSGQSPKITAGGTLFSTVNGGTAVAGATVTLTDSKGSKIKMITGKTGNFYTGSAISFPATIEVSKCPDTVAMKTTITAGGCNSCHNASMRLHLP